MSDVMTEQDRLNKVASDLRGNKARLQGKIEASKMELASDEDLLLNFDAAIAGLERAGAAKEAAPEDPLSAAAGSTENASPAASNDGVQGTDANGSPV